MSFSAYRPTYLAFDHDTTNPVRPASSRNVDDRREEREEGDGRTVHRERGATDRTEQEEEEDGGREGTIDALFYRRDNGAVCSSRQRVQGRSSS